MALFLIHLVTFPLEGRSWDFRQPSWANLLLDKAHIVFEKEKKKSYYIWQFSFFLIKKRNSPTIYGNFLLSINWRFSFFSLGLVNSYLYIGLQVAQEIEAETRIQNDILADLVNL